MKTAAMIALALTAFAQVATAQTLPAATGTQQPVSTTATALTDLLSESASLVMRARRDFPASRRASPMLQALEIDYPGVTDYVIDHTLPNAELRIKERGARMQPQIAAYISANMTEGDLAKVLSFYRGPAGTRLLDIARDASAVPIMRRVGSSAGQLTGSDVASGTAEAAAAMGGFSAKLTDAERTETRRFGESAAGKKWEALQPGLNGAMADILNREAQVSLPIVRAETAAAIADYKRDHPKKAPS